MQILKTVKLDPLVSSHKMELWSHARNSVQTLNVKKFKNSPVFY